MKKLLVSVFAFILLVHPGTTKPNFATAARFAGAGLATVAIAQLHDDLFLGWHRPSAAQRVAFAAFSLATAALWISAIKSFIELVTDSDTKTTKKHHLS